MKNSIKKETLNIWNNKVKKLTFQGKFVELIIEENENIAWKSIINNTPKGILSFAMKSCVNGLNTPDNLKRWGKRKLDKCEICGNRSDLEHILNWCPVALKQGRMTWRHDSIVSHMTQAMKKVMPSDLTLYSDIPGHKMNSGTIPPDILVTSSRPDVVIVDRSSKEIHILELTCSFEKNIESAHTLKSRKYNDLKSDLEDKGWTANLVPFEIGSRGLITKRNKSSIIKTLKKTHMKLNHNRIFKDVSKISLLCSFVLFQAHAEPSWEDPPFLHP